MLMFVTANKHTSLPNDDKACHGSRPGWADREVKINRPQVKRVKRGGEKREKGGKRGGTRDATLFLYFLVLACPAA